MRTSTFRCEECGTETAGDLSVRPTTWWLLEDQGKVQRTGPLDFCSLRCLTAWLQHPELHAMYAADYAEKKDG